MGINTVISERYLEAKEPQRAGI